MRATRPPHARERTESPRPRVEPAPEREAEDRGASGARAPLGSFGVSLTAPAVQLAALAGAVARVHEAADVHAVAARGVGGRGASLPHAERIQRAFGRHDVSGVRAHVGGAAAEASAALGAAAYARGEDLAFARGPDLFVAAHEAAHVVQQRAGVSLSGGVGSAGDAYERHADEVAHAVVAGRSAEPLLDRYRGSGGGARVQRKEATGADDTTTTSADAATGADAATTTGGAGNAGATPGAVTAPKFVDETLDMMWMVAGARQGPALEKAFRMLDGRGPTGPWAHVSWNVVKTRAIAPCAARR